MNALLFLVPIALFLGLLGLGAFVWALRSGQYEDVDGAAWRALQEEEEDEERTPAGPAARRSTPPPRRRDDGSGRRTWP
ncbi:cbb3-type cytochrome oxidase assembly protein CcoS [Jiella sp. MQZ13P-4]|uniref:Cbb3-type cytochrome oxidase assembly protein CcoS n=1 Tax=Jiella sonneratiae TaxID=2816856 RepID=A0ABS3J8Z9_9HYPH|nr:cbb3-type cytochrome oxidase assembly protein CcoS [Jiella sonneratiae]